MVSDARLRWLSISLVLIVVLSAPAIACDDGGGPAPSPTESIITPAPSMPSTVGTAAECLAASEREMNTVIYGAGAGDYLADRFSLATGDFNGDGLADILVGAPLADGPREDRVGAGEAYVFFGSEDLPKSVDLAEGPDLIAFGEKGGDNFGFTVAAGDVNGDGIDDILIGARFAATGLGKVYAIYGKADLTGSFDAAAAEFDLTVVGRDRGDYLSIALASGDTNGDGIDDFIMGASGGRGPQNDRDQAGETYVLLGSASLSSTVDLAQTTPHLTVYAAHPGDTLPNHIATGDLNGDGREELLLGAPFAENGDETRAEAGEVYIVSVPEVGGVMDLADATEGFARVTGADAGDALGFYVATGDVNGDGVRDAIIGTRNGDGPDNQRINAGEVHVVFGARDIESLDLRNEQADLTLYGAKPGDTLGFAVSSGDVNGDGTDDMIVGAPIAGGCLEPSSKAGEVYVFYGSQDASGAIDLAQGEADRELLGREAEDELGFSVNSGDFNGDGKYDVAAGALLGDGVDNNREDAGETIVILGR